MNINIYNNDMTNIKIYNTNLELVKDITFKNTVFININRGIYLIKLYYKANIVGIYVLVHNKEYNNYNLLPNIDKLLYSPYYNNIVPSIDIESFISNIEKEFYLYDYFYQGLRIKRGEIILG